MASPTPTRKRTPRLLSLLLLAIASVLGAIGCGGPSAPPIDLDSEPQGTDRESLRTAMAQERPIFFETLEGERFYAKVRGTTAEGFDLGEKERYEGESSVPMSERVHYRYAEILRAVPVPEAGNSTRGFVLGTTVLVVAVLAVVALFAAFPVASS